MTITYTPVHIPGVKLNDRRIAASDEYRTRNRRAIYLHDIIRGPSIGTSRGEVIRQPRQRGYDIRTSHLRRRDLTTIRRVILHQTGEMLAGPTLFPSPDFREDNHRLDVVIAHFVIRSTGEVLYTHDAQLVLNGTAALRDSIEIEFHGSFNNHNFRRSQTELQVAEQDDRVDPVQLLAARNLLRWLAYSSGMAITSIHPHQQYSPESRPNCPGPDIWVNVGEWALREFDWNTNTGRRGRVISERISNPLFSQNI